MENSSESDPWWKFWKRRRFVLAILAFLGFVNVYALRVNLSVAIVAMTNNRTVMTNGSSEIIPPEFKWNSKQQGLVLSSFFYGYICTQVAGGILATRFGAARLFGIGIATTAALTILTPPIARASIYAFVALRIIEGLFEGVTFPVILALLSKWAPQTEQAALVAVVLSGAQVGTIIAMPLSGIFADNFGWASVFYGTGVLGIIWYGFWWLFVYENPSDDPRISRKELTYLEESLGTAKESNKISLPWKEIATSMPVWATISSHFTENYGFYTMLTQLPSFMKDVLNYDVQKAGFVSSLPYLAMALILTIAGRTADWLCNRKILSTTAVRKLYNCGAFLVQAFFTLASCFLRDPVGIIVCLTFAVGLGGFSWSSFGTNYLDLAPKHAGVLFGISNTFATLAGIITPLVTGFIVKDKTVNEWRIVFYISSSIYLWGCVMYGIFGDGKLQPWAEEENTNKSVKNSSNGPAKDVIKQEYHNEAFVSTEVE